jgi:hypothetical protein
MEAVYEPGCKFRRNNVDNVPVEKQISKWRIADYGADWSGLKKFIAAVDALIASPKNNRKKIRKDKDQL